MLGTPLHVAVAQGSVPIAKLLISRGANIEAPSEDRGARAIHLAANFGELETLNLLLDVGADIDAREQMGFASNDILSFITHDQLEEGV